jgi:cytochrome c2
MKTTVSILTVALLWAAAVATGAGEPPNGGTASATTNQASADSSGRDLGIGPVKHVELGPLDPQLAARGKGLFDNKCTICHSLDKRKIGPALGDVLGRRAPEFVMNMILNATQMEKHDPTAKHLLDEYKVAMQVLNLDRKDARAILEYLRQEHAARTKEKKQKPGSE